MIRRAIAVALLGGTVTGCAAKETGPAWPAPSEREDGGESLAPHKAAEIEASREEEPELPKAAPAPPKVQPAATKVAAPTPPPKPKPSTKQAPEPKPIEILAPPPKKRHGR
jgi:hypothetical protein